MRSVVKEPNSCGFSQQVGVRQKAVVDFDLRPAKVVLVELEHWCRTVLCADEHPANEERVSQREQAVPVKLAPGGGTARGADSVRLDAERMSVETQAVVFETLRAQERFKRRFPGSFGWWAHWFLTSESASRTLMNACRVTPSRRAS